jgi:peroxiredoxin
MVVFFTAIVTTKIIEGENINCNCFGNITDGKIDYSTIVRNICLISVSIILAVYYSYIKNKLTDDSSLSRLSDKKVYRNFFIQNFKTYLLYFTFFFISVQSVVLSYQNRVLKERLTILMQKNDLLQQGDTILPFFVKDINGNEKLILSNENQKTVIFLFSTRCSACTSNYPIWNKLYDTLSHAGINTFALSIDTVSESIVKSIKTGYNIYSVSNKDDIRKNFKQLITPQTVMIDENNKVIGVWIGILNSYNIFSIIKRF